MSTYQRPQFTYRHLNTLHPNVPAVKVWSESTLNGALCSGNYAHAPGNQAHIQAYPPPPTTPSNDPQSLTNDHGHGNVHRQGHGQGRHAHANHSYLHPAQLPADAYAQTSNQVTHLSLSSAVQSGHVYPAQKTFSSSYSPYSTSSASSSRR